MLGIIVLNYNNYTKTIECVNSILKTTKSDCILYIIDNCSINESFNILKKNFNKYKNIKIFKTEINNGYSSGNNFGIRVAKNDGCDAILISNNDIIYYDNTIDTLYSVLREKKLFMIAPKILDINGKVQESIKYKLYSFFEYIINETYLSNFIRKHIIIPTQTQQVKWLSGCCFMVDIVQFEQIGFFDEYTFLYFEEYIIASKAKEKSMKMYYCPSVEVLHYHGSTIGNLNINACIAHWNSEKYYLENYENWNYIKLKILYCIRVLEVLWSFGKKGKLNQISEFINKTRRKNNE